MSADEMSARYHSSLQTVFLDRDGVLNRKMPEGRYVTVWEEFELLPGVVEAIRRLNLAAIRVIVVSNQRGIALGRTSIAAVKAIHERFQKVLQAEGAHIDGIYFCPHPKNSCRCRKPLPGLFEQASHHFPQIAAETSAIIGDSLSDVQFGRNLGMLTVFIEGDPTLRKPGDEDAIRLADLNFHSMPEAVEFLLKSPRRSE